jgi:hypothetical protein
MGPQHRHFRWTGDRPASERDALRDGNSKCMTTKTTTIPRINSNICVPGSFQPVRAVVLPLRTSLPSSSLLKERKMDGHPHRLLKTPTEPIKIQQQKQHFLPTIHEIRRCISHRQRLYLRVPSRYTSTSQVVSEHSTAGSPLLSGET